jgi:RimJ/RimL family protein N-acetyltransferase
VPDAAFTRLTTDRLVLRRFHGDDLDPFVAHRSDPEVARYQSWDAPYDRNTRSAALLERVGMRREGHLLESTWSKGEWCNELRYAVLRREWLG